MISRRTEHSPKTEFIFEAFFHFRFIALLWKLKKVKTYSAPEYSQVFFLFGVALPFIVPVYKLHVQFSFFFNRKACHNNFVYSLLKFIKQIVLFSMGAFWSPWILTTLGILLFNIIVLSYIKLLRNRLIILFWEMVTFLCKWISTSVRKKNEDL